MYGRRCVLVWQANRCKVIHQAAVPYSHRWWQPGKWSSCCNRWSETLRSVAHRSECVQRGAGPRCSLVGVPHAIHVDVKILSQSVDGVITRLDVLDRVRGSGIVVTDEGDTIGTSEVSEVGSEGGLDFFICVTTGQEEVHNW